MYRTLVDFPEQRLQRALKMYDRYFAEGHSMIGVDYVYIRTINQQLIQNQNAPINLFDDVYDEEIRNTLLDCYNRFMLSKTFTEFTTEHGSDTKVLPSL